MYVCIYIYITTCSYKHKIPLMPPMTRPMPLMLAMQPIILASTRNAYRITNLYRCIHKQTTFRYVSVHPSVTQQCKTASNIQSGNVGPAPGRFELSKGTFRSREATGL